MGALSLDRVPTINEIIYMTDRDQQQKPAQELYVEEQQATESHTPDQDSAANSHTQQAPPAQEASTKEPDAASEGMTEDAPKADAEAQQQIETLTNQIVRLSADLENMRRRHMQELAKAHSYGLEKCFRELIPVLDSLAMALSSAGSEKQDNAFYEGVDLTHTMLTNSLEKFGLALINPVPKDNFDPAVHEAITMLAVPDTPANCIVEVVQCGYSLNDRLLRPARVVVSKAND